MKSQLDLIESDFKLLQSEFKKKNPQIKESVEHALAWIQQDRHRPEKMMCQPVEVLEPLRLLFEAKISKTFTVAMNSLQRITQAFNITEAGVILTVLGMLRDASSETIDEMTEIRILQMILTFLDPTKVQLSKEFTNLVVDCCFQILDSKSYAVKSTIQATLRQLFSIIVDSFNTMVSQATPDHLRHLLQSRAGVSASSKDIQQLQILYKDRVCSKQVYSVLQDVIQNLAFTILLFDLKAPKKPQSVWNFKPSQFSKCVVLDCLTQCLTTTNETFRYFPEISTIFELQIVPTLEQLMQSKSINSILGVREMKIAILIISSLGSGFSLLRQLLSDADSLTTKAKDGTIKFDFNWRGLIAFECLQVAVSNPYLSHLFSVSSLSIGAPIIIQILESYIKVSKAIESADPSVRQAGKTFQKVIQNQAIETEVPPPTLPQIERIIVESISKFAENIKNGFANKKIKTQRQFKIEAKCPSEDELRSRQTLSLSWQPLLQISQTLIQTGTDDSNLTLLLQTYISLIDACGTAQVLDGRDALLASLCKECVSVQGSLPVVKETKPVATARGKPQTQVSGVFANEKCTVTSRNLQVARTLLSVAEQLNGILDVKSWFVVLETMQRVECTISEKLQLNGQLKRKDKLSINADGVQQIINFEELKQKVADLRAEAEESKRGLEETKCARGCDEQSLLDSFDRFFISSINLDMQAISGLICALAQLTVGALEQLKYSGQNSFLSGPHLQRAISSDKASGGMFMTQTDSEILAQINTFAISRLVESALVNTSRIEGFWKIIVAHFDILSSCPVLAIRQLTIEALQTIVLEIFAHKKVSAKFKQSVVPQPKQIPDKSPDDMPETETPAILDYSSDDPATSDQIEDEEAWANNAWQSTILQPLADQLRSNHAQDKFTVIKGFEKIIQKCGQQIRNEGWRIIIVTISKSLEFESEQTVACGFRCLKLVVNNFIDRLSQENFVTVLNAIHLYASSKANGSHNNNLIAIGMFQNVADYTAKQIQKREGSQEASFVDQSKWVQDADEINFEAIWEILFKRIESLGSDHRTEVRCTNIHTLENIIMIHGGSFSPSSADVQIWRKLFLEVLQSMLNLAVDKYAGGLTKPLQTNSDPGQLKPTKKSQKTFEEASVVKALQQNDAQWEETCKILIQVSLRAIKKYFLVVQEGHTCKLVGKFYDMVIRHIVSILAVGSIEACKSIFKCLQDFFSQQTCLRLFLSKHEQTYLLIQATIDFLQIDQRVTEEQKSPHDTKQAALKVLKLCPIFVETLLKIFNQQALQMVIEEPNSQDDKTYAIIMEKRLCELVLKLLAQMLSSSGKTSEQQFGSQLRLLTEEKVVFDFIEQLNDFYLCLPDIQLLYIDFLMSFLEYRGDARSEAFIRRSLQIIYNKVVSGKISADLVQQFIPRLFDRMQSIIDLRYNDAACTLIIALAKGQQTLFMAVGLYSLLLASFLINTAQFKLKFSTFVQRAQEMKMGSFMVQAEFQDLLFVESVEFNQVKPELIEAEPFDVPSLRSVIWERVVKFMKTSLLFDPEKVREHSKSIQQELFKTSQDLDMQVVNFIVNCLLPNTSNVQIPGFDSQQTFERSLVQVIDAGCSNQFTQSQNQSPSSTNLSRYCFNNLFNLCRFQEDPEPEEEEAKVQARKINETRQRIAKIATPILINRCRQTLRRFVTDEIKVGSLSMPRNRINEAVFILESLRNLDCFPQSFSKVDLMSVSPLERTAIAQTPLQCSISNKKGHLMELMPVFADLVMSNEVGLKENLRFIFLEISKALSERQKPEASPKSDRNTQEEF